MKKCFFGIVCALICFFIFESDVYAFPVQGLNSSSFDNYSAMPNLKSQGSYIFGSTSNKIEFGYNDSNSTGTCFTSYTTFADNMSKPCFFTNPSQLNVGDYLLPGLAMQSFYGDSAESWFMYVYQLEEGDYLRAGETYTFSLDYIFKLDTLNLDQILGVTDLTSAANLMLNYGKSDEVGYQWSSIKNYNRTYSIFTGDFFNGTIPNSSYVLVTITFEYTPIVDATNFLVQVAYGPTVSWGNYVSSMMAFYYPLIYHDENFTENYELIDIPVSDRGIVFSGVESGKIFLKTCYDFKEPTEKIDFTGSFSYLTSFDLNVPNIELLERDEIEFKWYHDFYEHDSLFGFEFDLYGDTDRIGIFYVTDYIVQKDIQYDKEKVPDNIFQKAWNWVKGLFNKDSVGSEENTKKYLNKMQDARCSFYIPKGMHYSKSTFITEENTSTAVDNDYVAYTNFDYVDSTGTLHNVGHKYGQILEDNSLSFNPDFVFDNYKADIEKFTSPLNVLSNNMTFISDNINATLYSYISIVILVLLLLFVLRINK